jgi:hypothetical protein
MSRANAFAILGWVVAAAFLAAGIPPFLHMPLWCDVTLYDVAARTVLAGGVHYRDVFDTNPPGFVWLMCAVRATLGPSIEALRAVDLGIVFAAAAALLVWARRAGASHAGIAWAAAAIASFYPLIHEFNHVQRDVWMMLPALAAIGLRFRRIKGPPTAVCGIAEGLLWGFGCWIKPHVAFIAAAVWLVTANRLGSRRKVLLDFAAVFAGGLLAGAAGLVWLIGTGAWPYFLDVWRTWNPAYAALIRDEFLYRLLQQQFGYFAPYSILAFLALPLAVRNLRDRSSEDAARFRRAVLAAVYLAWLLSTLLFQRGFHYAHIPETLLMLALFAANRWPLPFAIVLIQFVNGGIWLIADRFPAMKEAHAQTRDSVWIYRQFTSRNAAFDPERAKWWGESFTCDSSRELRQGVAMWMKTFSGHEPVELGAVADYLRSRNVGDRELIAWHDSPHELYLELGIRPGFRFMHVSTASGFGPAQREEIHRELMAVVSHARFAVSDMYRITEHHAGLSAPDWEKLLPAWQLNEFPFDQPIVFRSPNGRYLVHEIRNPTHSCEIPRELDQAEPPKK